MGKKMVLRFLLTIFLISALVSCASVEQKQQAVVSAPDFGKVLKKQELLPPPPAVLKETVVTRDPLEDIYVTMDAVQQSLSSILYMIAAESGLNLIISPDVNTAKPFTISVKNMPARDALNAVTENAGVYYVVEGNALKIKSVVTKIFKLPFIRNTPEQTALVGGDIFGSSGSDTVFIHGDYRMEYKSEKERQDIQTQIIGHVRSVIFPDSADIPDTTPITTQQAAAQMTVDPSGQPVVVQQAASTQTKSTATSTSSTATGNSYYKGEQGYNYNMFTGLLRVSTSPEKMKHIEDFIGEITKEMNKQVLIEVRLVEVVLNEQNAYGINWSGELFNSDTFTGTFNYGYASGALLGGLSPIGTIANSSASKLFAFMAAQGKVETVGNPRLRVMNGQSAMISSGQIKPFWEMTRETSTDETEGDTITYTRTMVLDGLILGVTPYIKDDRTITLSIVPIFSNVEEEKSIVNVDGETVASYPVVNMKEAGTTLNMVSGSTVVMGGLISNSETTVEEKIPVLGDIPVLGNIFKGKYRYQEKRELVIFLTTTIIDGGL